MEAEVPQDDPSLLERAARAVAADPQLVGGVLCQVCAAQGWDAATLAAWLGLERVWLPVLALCTRPDPADPRCAAAVADLATFTGCDPDRLAALLRAG